MPGRQVGAHDEVGATADGPAASVGGGLRVVHERVVPLAMMVQVGWCRRFVPSDRSFAASVGHAATMLR